MFKAQLILERFDKENRLLERRRQPSRSFVQGFLGLLYVAHANLSYSSPYSQKDILNHDRNINAYHLGVPLLIASPPGWSNLVGRSATGSTGNPTHISADLVGIQVGQGTTPPTPGDYALEARIPHSEHIPETADSRGEYYLQQVTPGEYEFYGDRWYATEFTCMWPHQLRRVRLKFYREGLPGTVTISIRDSLTGADLITQTFDGNALTTDPAGEWVNIDFPSPYLDLVFLEDYFIVMRATAGDLSNSVHVICDADETYGGGVNSYSSNAGGNWSSHSGSGYSYLCLFEEFGRDLTRGILYGGCEVYGLSFSHPNGQFTIRRFFYNASGDSWTINEVGIYAMGSHESGSAWSFLAARDLVSPGIAVANNELLGVTYVPQITV